ncbi:MAG: hypothetical protein KIG63_07495 [Methanobrevibacter sp.]|nr:hypothetical protein [Methanobrevibacter sp.]
MADSTKGNSTYTLSFKVDVGSAKGNLKEYKEYIDNLKGSLLALDKGSKQYEENAKELKEAQEKLNEVMKLSKSKGDAVEGSYDNLSQTMSKLKKEWKATGDESKRAELGKRIAEINDKLKNMDASVGVFSRNVGNYQNAFEGAFLKLKDGVTSSIPAINKLNSAFNLIVANPIGATISAIALAITAVVRSMKSSESQFNQFKVATSGIKVVIDGVKNALSSVSKVFVDLISKVNTLAIGLLKRLKDGFRSLGWDKWADGMETFLSKIETYQELEQKEINIEQRRRQIAVDSAKVQNEVAELRAKIAEKEKYTTKQRLEFVEQWENAEKRRSQLQVELAQAEYDAIKRKNELTENSTKDYDAENDAYVRLIQAQGQYNESLRRINETRATLLGQIGGEEGGGITRAFETIASIESSALTAEVKVQQTTLDTMSQQYDNYINQRIEQNRLLKENEKAALEDRKANIKSFVTSTTSIISLVANAWESDIKAQIEAGKISEEEGEKQFESVKAMQTAVAIINTISAGIKAFEGVVGSTAGWGLAAAIAEMTATIAAGMVQVHKIQSTTIGTKSTSSNTPSVPNLGNITNEYNPTYTQNITNQTELSQLANAMRKQPIYVKVSDVESVTATQNQRISETTW